MDKNNESKSLMTVQNITTGLIVVDTAFLALLGWQFYTFRSFVNEHNRKQDKEIKTLKKTIERQNKEISKVIGQKVAIQELEDDREQLRDEVKELRDELRELRDMMSEGKHVPSVKPPKRQIVKGGKKPASKPKSERKSRITQLESEESESDSDDDLYKEFS